MIKPRYAPIVFALFMSAYMVSCMTGLITWVNTGFAQGFFMRWARAFLIAWPCAFLLVIFGAPHIRKLVAKLVRTAQQALSCARWLTAF